MKKESLAMVLILMANLAFAQGFNTRNKYSSYELGLNSSYFFIGDLNINSNRSFSPGFFIAINTKQNPRICNGFRFSMENPTARTLGRKDSLSDLNFIYYQARVTKFELYLTYDLIEHRGKYQKRPDFIPYIHAGFGWMNIKQKAWEGYEEKIKISRITNDRYQTNSLVLPIGMGLRFKSSKQTSLLLEVIYNYTLFNQLDVDYLHGFGNSKRKDSYFSILLGMSII